VQLHITSLPCGRLGADARTFIEWLSAAGQSWWQVLPLGPPDRWRSPYKSRSAFACWPALLEHPDAPVSPSEEAEFRERQAYWIGDWERASGGRKAVLDQVRFEREWLELRHYAREHRVKLIGDMPLYVARDSVDHRCHPGLFEDGLVAGAPPDHYTAAGQRWGNPVYRWPAAV
jgi:4-alpha-glucanotransferase